MARSRLGRMIDDTPQVSERFTSLICAGQPLEHVLLLNSGWACRERLLSDGRRALLDVYVPGDIIGIDHLFRAVAPDNIFALTDVSYHSLDCETLRRRIGEDGTLGLYLLECAMEATQEHYQQIVCLARLPAIERTVVFLARLCERLLARLGSKNSRPIRLPLTQRDLADHLGLNIIHLNRTLRGLRAAGVLRTQNGSLVIDDPALLQSMLKA